VFFIFGTEGSSSNIGAGDFFCPECNDYKQYKHIKVEKKISLFFIPIIPIEDLGHYIECQNCNSTFKTDVLDYDPKQEEENIKGMYFLGSLDIMISIALADKVLKNEEISTIISTFKLITGDADTINNVPLKKFVLDQIDKFRRENLSPIDISKSLAPNLNELGKEKVLRAAIYISKADGIIHEEEMKLLLKISEALLIPKTYANGIFAEEEVEFKR
jgi:hypothetical protein